MNNWSSIFFISTFFVLSACSQPELARDPDLKIPFVGTTSASRFILKNGLKVIVIEDHSSPTIAFQTWFKVGSRNEQAGLTGLAHLFEHMMFKGTKNLKPGEFDRKLEIAGVENSNAFTTRDYTAYVHELPKDKLELVLQLESERMQNLVVDEEAFATEREVVKNERRYRTVNSPEGMMYQALYETAYTSHPYHWPVIGYEMDLNRVSAQDAAKFYKTFYAPNLATIVIVGDVKTKEALELIGTYYSKIPERPYFPPATPQEPTQKKVRRKNLKLSLQVQKLYMAYSIPGSGDPTAPSFEVLQAILSDGRGSRLQRALVDTGLTTEVSSGSFQHPEPGLFVFSATMQKGKRAAQAEAAIKRELETLSKNLVSTKELERAKNLVLFQFYSGLGTNADKANFIGRYETTLGQFEDGLNIYRSTRYVTPENIQKVVQTYFQPTLRTIIRGFPK